jgi:hypothetical protein
MPSRDYKSGKSTTHILAVVEHMISIATKSQIGMEVMRGCAVDNKVAANLSDLVRTVIKAVDRRSKFRERRYDLQAVMSSTRVDPDDTAINRMSRRWLMETLKSWNGLRGVEKTPASLSLRRRYTQEIIEEV